MFKKILAALALILLLSGVAFSVYLVSQKTNFFSKASSSESPQQVKVTNLSDNSFTISWVTGKKVPGFISWGPSEKLGKTTMDDRDINNPSPRFTHHITLKDLDPKTIYYYKINSGSVTLGNQGKSFAQETAPVSVSTPPLAEPIYGAINKKDGGVPGEALVYINIGEGTPLSSFTRGDGKWLITLNNSRTKDLTNYINVSDSDEVSLFIEGAISGTNNSKATVAQGKQILRSILNEEAKTLSFEINPTDSKTITTQVSQPSSVKANNSGNFLETIKGLLKLPK